MESIFGLAAKILEPTKNRPFKRAVLLILFASVSGLMPSLIDGASAFAVGILLSLGWASAMYVFDLDLPHEFQNIKTARASLGFFAIITGILVGIVGPNYLNTLPQATEWLVICGLMISAQLGFPLLLVFPLRSLSVCAGYLTSAIILHSIILRFPNEFINGDTAKLLVLFLLIISTWFLAQWLFFDTTNPLLMEESRNAKRIKSFVAVASGLFTIMEFINILYSLTQLSK